MKLVAWDQCDANARNVDEDTGHETVVTCQRERHAAPGDTSCVHFDTTLMIYWRYADPDVRYDG